MTLKRKRCLFLPGFKVNSSCVCCVKPSSSFLVWNQHSSAASTCLHIGPWLCCSFMMSVSSLRSSCRDPAALASCLIVWCCVLMCRSRVSSLMFPTITWRFWFGFCCLPQIWTWILLLLFLEIFFFYYFCLKSHNEGHWDSDSWKLSGLFLDDMTPSGLFLCDFSL